jgi:hypothetical protein
MRIALTTATASAVVAGGRSTFVVVIVAGAEGRRGLVGRVDMVVEVSQGGGETVAVDLVGL